MRTNTHLFKPDASVRIRRNVCDNSSASLADVNAQARLLKRIQNDSRTACEGVAQVTSYRTSLATHHLSIRYLNRRFLTQLATQDKGDMAPTAAMLQTFLQPVAIQAHC